MYPSSENRAMHSRECIRREDEGELLVHILTNWDAAGFAPPDRRTASASSRRRREAGIFFPSKNLSVHIFL